MVYRLQLFTGLLLFALQVSSQPPSQERIEQARVFFNEGVRLGIDHKFEKAAEQFEKAIELNHLYAEAFLYKGLALIELGDYKDAERNLTITIELDPAFSDQAHYFRGLARYHKGRYHEAIDDLTIAIRMNPDYAAFYRRGRANLSLREYKRSLQDFDIAIRLNPDFYEAYLYRGINLYFLNEFEDAVADLEIAKKEFPDNPDAFYYSGLARTGIKNSYVAIEDLNRAIELDPSYAPAYEARAKARENTGNMQAATSDRVLAREKQSHQQPKAGQMGAAIPAQSAARPQSSTDIDFGQLFSSSRQQNHETVESTDVEHSVTTLEQNPNPLISDQNVNHNPESYPTATPAKKPAVSIDQISSGTYSGNLELKTPMGFGVQVASYSNTANLLSLADAYNQKYHQRVFINVAQVNGRKLYKLIIGEFDNRNDAETFRDKLRIADFPDSFLVLYSNL